MKQETYNKFLNFKIEILNQKVSKEEIAETMPTYELSLVVKQALKRPELVSAVKRMGENVINNGGYIRNLEFLGHRNLPQRQRANDEIHSKGSYFLLKVDLPVEGMYFKTIDKNIYEHQYIQIFMFY